MTTSTLDLPDFALVRYREGSRVHLGLLHNGLVLELDHDALGAQSLNSFLEAPDWVRLRRLAQERAGEGVSIASLTLTAPVEPRQVLQAGANYRQHVIELVASGLSNGRGMEPDEARAMAADMMDKRAAEGEPYFFLGLPACVVGDDVPLLLPASSDTHDWELELAVVIGKPAFRVSREQAMDHVAGYTMVNDISTREFTFRKDMKDIGSDWYKSKNSPGFLPTGPFLVPADALDPADTHVELRLNGKVMQDASTADLLFDIPALISVASQTAPLLPGDLLLTGSPAGNGQHYGRFLRHGDVVEGRIDGLGVQTVRCIGEGAMA